MAPGLTEYKGFISQVDTAKTIRFRQFYSQLSCYMIEDYQQTLSF